MIHNSGISSVSLERAAVEPDRGVSRHGDPLFMTSLARGLLVIGALSAPSRRRTIAEISRSTGFSRAAVRRCLYTLCELGYAERESHTYRLLPKVLAISHGAQPTTPLVPLSGRQSAQNADACAQHQRHGQ